MMNEKQQMNLEVGKALNQVSDDLVRLQSQPNSEYLIASIHLRLSNTKGIVQKYKLDPITKLAEAMVQNFEGIRKGLVKIDSALMAVFIACVQLMQNLVRDPWNAVYASQVNFSVSMLELLTTVLALQPSHYNRLE